jgi:WD40 repeat protein
VRSATPCPSDADLQRLLLGLVDGARAAELEGHVSGCPACARRAQQLPAEDAVVHVLRGMAPEEKPRGELVDALVPLLKRLRPSPLTSAQSSAMDGPATIASAPPAGPDTSFLSPPAQAGEIGRIGPYSIHDVLGAGGMGVVFRGHDPRLMRSIAVKVVRPELLARAGMRDRFLQEARAAAAVEHDHIVGVFAVENHEGLPCLTMPLLRGQSLEQRLRSARGALPVAELLRIGRETATGLAAAHARGLIHRDIKPANLWLEAPHDRVKILDFGLACIRAADAEGPAGAAGTPGYMAPEQARGRPVDHRADLYSLGCVLYRAATGQPPFPDVGTFTAMIRAVLIGPPPVAKARPGLPPALCRLIDSLLAKEPANRPASASAVVKTIATIENDWGARRARRRWLLGLTAAALVGGGGVWAWLAGRTPAPPEPVRVTFVCDSPAPRIVLLGEGWEQPVDLNAEKTLSLPPGDYQLKPAAAVPGRELVPDHIVVPPGGPLTVNLAFVGEVARSTAHTHSVTGVGVARINGRLTVLSAALDRTIGAWQPDTPDPPRFARLSSPARCLAVSPNGAVAATAGGNRQPPAELTVQLWDTTTLRPSGEPLPGHTRLITALAFAPDGKQLLSAAADGARLWDLKTREDQTLMGHDGGIFAARFAPDGKRALTGDEDGRAILWDLVMRQPLHKLAAHQGAIRAVAFVPKGFVTAGDDGAIRVWDETTFKGRDLGSAGKAVLALGVSPDGTRLLSGEADGTLRLWSLVESKAIQVFAGQGQPINAVAFTPDGRQAVSGGADRTVRLWQLPF